MYGYKYYVNSKSPSIVIEVFDDKLSDNIDNSTSYQTLPCKYVINTDTISEDAYDNNIPETQGPQAHPLQDRHRVENRKESDSNLFKKELEQAQILIAESETDLLLLFADYLSAVGLKSETANTGDKAIDCFMIELL